MKLVENLGKNILNKIKDTGEINKLDVTIVGNEKFISIIANYDLNLEEYIKYINLYKETFENNNPFGIVSLEIPSFGTFKDYLTSGFIKKEDIPIEEWTNFALEVIILKEVENYFVKNKLSLFELDLQLHLFSDRKNFYTFNSNL